MINKKLIILGVVAGAGLTLGGFDIYKFIKYREDIYSEYSENVTLIMDIDRIEDQFEKLQMHKEFHNHLAAIARSKTLNGLYQNSIVMERFITELRSNGKETLIEKNHELMIVPKRNDVELNPDEFEEINIDELEDEDEEETIIEEDEEIHQEDTEKNVVEEKVEEEKVVEKIPEEEITTTEIKPDKKNTTISENKKETKEVIADNKPAQKKDDIIEKEEPNNTNTLAKEQTDIAATEEPKKEYDFSKCYVILTDVIDSVLDIYDEADDVSYKKFKVFIKNLTLIKDNHPEDYIKIVTSMDKLNKKSAKDQLAEINLLMKKIDKDYGAELRRLSRADRMKALDNYGNRSK